MRQWTKMSWTDRYSGKRYRISTTADMGGVGMARVQTYRDVLEDFLYHPEAKSAGANGRQSDRQTVGLLCRQVVRSVPELTPHVGKESNRLEEVEAGIEHSPEEVWTEYQDPGRDPWATLVLPVLRQMPIERRVEATGLHRRSLFALRAGERRPHPGNRQVLVAAAGAYAREQLLGAGIEPTSDNITTCATYLSVYANIPG